MRKILETIGIGSTISTFGAVLFMLSYLLLPAFSLFPVPIVVIAAILLGVDITIIVLLADWLIGE